MSIRKKKKSTKSITELKSLHVMTNDDGNGLPWKQPIQTAGTAEKRSLDERLSL